VFAKGSEPNEKENRLGLSLLRQYAERGFNIGDHKDEYGKRVNLAVRKKLEGQDIAPGIKQRITGMAVDLAALLEESLKKE
jgi:non-homologous end joining protein Ku